MLQRITEDFEYSSLLDEAAECEDSTEQLAYVTVFTISSYSTTINRTTKPFNPLLGETYECDRTDDLGWRSVAEQVSTIYFKFKTNNNIVEPMLITTYVYGQSCELRPHFNSPLWNK